MNIKQETLVNSMFGLLSTASCDANDLERYNKDITAKHNIKELRKNIALIQTKLIKLANSIIRKEK